MFEQAELTFPKLSAIVLLLFPRSNLTAGEVDRDENWVVGDVEIL